jgi:transposase
VTHKGVGLLSALDTVHTLGNPARFASTKRAVAYTGLDPLEQLSVGKVRYGAISKDGSNVLRHLPGQAMHVASCYDGELKAFHKRLANRRSKSIAKVAPTRKLLIRLFIMLRDRNRLHRF